MSDYYDDNVVFWESAWSRVKNLYKEPNKVDYLQEMPDTLKKHGAKKVLDIACGSGWLSVFLNSFGFEVTGVDISETAIKLAHQWVTEDKLTNIDFQVQDMMALDFPEGYFDAIMVNSTFEHLNYDRGQEFFNLAKRVVKTDGLLFGCFDEVCVGTKGEFQVLEDGSRVYTDDMRQGMLLRNYSNEELQNLLAASDWQIISQRTAENNSRIIWAQNKK